MLSEDYNFCNYLDGGGRRTKSQILENRTRKHPRICPTGSVKTYASAPASSVDDNNAGMKNLKM